MARTLREWKRGSMIREDYRKERKEYREICERKRRKENERLKEDVINRERRRKMEVSRDIGRKE